MLGLDDFGDRNNLGRVTVAFCGSPEAFQALRATVVEPAPLTTTQALF